MKLLYNQSAFNYLLYCIITRFSLGDMIKRDNRRNACHMTTVQSFSAATAEPFKDQVVRASRVIKPVCQL